MGRGVRSGKEMMHTHNQQPRAQRSGATYSKRNNRFSPHLREIFHTALGTEEFSRTFPVPKKEISPNRGEEIGSLDLQRRERRSVATARAECSNDDVHNLQHTSPIPLLPGASTPLPSLLPPSLRVHCSPPHPQVCTSLLHVLLSLYSLFSHSSHTSPISLLPVAPLAHTFCHPLR